MRAAICTSVFNAQTNSDNYQPFVPASHASILVAVPSPRSGIEVTKRKINVFGGMINIGAVSYPYSNPDEMMAALVETSSLRSGTTCWPYTYLGQGEDRVVHPVKWDPNIHSYRYIKGGGVVASDRVQYMWFDSELLAKSKAGGDVSNYHPDYIRWLFEVDSGRDNRYIDVAHPAGRDMAYVMSSLYFGEPETETRLVLPEFYVISRDILPFREGLIDDTIIRGARTGQFAIPAFRPRTTCVVGDIVEGTSFFTVVTTRVKNSQGKYYVTGDHPRNIYVPKCDTTRILVDVYEEFFNIGDEIPDSAVVRPTQDVASVLSYNPVCSSVDAALPGITDDGMDELTKMIRQLYTPEIKGQDAYALSAIKELPGDVNTSQIMIENRKVEQVLEVNSLEEALVGKEGSIRYDLYHHQWFDRDRQGRKFRRRPRARKPQAQTVTN